MDIKPYMEKIGKKARIASKVIASADSKTKKLALIKLTKAVASFVCAIFISIALLAGLPLAGSLTLLSLSTIGTSVAIAAHFYQKNMTYKMKESAV